MGVAAECLLHRVFGQEVAITVLHPDLDVGQVGIDGGGDVGRQRPGRGGPDEQPGVFAAVKRQPHVQRVVRDLGVGVDQLVLRERRAAARAPGHGALRHLDPAALVTAPQKAPDVLDVAVGVGVVGVVPIHPLPQARGLRGLDRRIGGDPLAAGLGKGFEPEGLDVALGLEPELFFDFDLEP